MLDRTRQIKRSDIINLERMLSSFEYKCEDYNVRCLDFFFFPGSENQEDVARLLCMQKACVEEFGYRTIYLHSYDDKLYTYRSDEADNIRDKNWILP